MKQVLWVWFLATACRGYHDSVPVEDCQPYALECTTCRLEDDLADRVELQRVYRCALEDGSEVDAVQRRSPDAAADDTHFYDTQTGLRRAAVRRHDAPVEACGTTLEEEWSGEILDACEAYCEHEDQPQSDPELPICVVEGTA